MFRIFTLNRAIERKMYGSAASKDFSLWAVFSLIFSFLLAKVGIINEGFTVIIIFLIGFLFWFLFDEVLMKKIIEKKEKEFKKKLKEEGFRIREIPLRLAPFLEYRKGNKFKDLMKKGLIKPLAK